jgi:hypothetical protein
MIDAANLRLPVLRRELAPTVRAAERAKFVVSSRPPRRPQLDAPDLDGNF